MLEVPVVAGVEVAVEPSLDRVELRVLGVHVIKEARFAILGAVIMGFGRAVSEVGLSLMVGGNIKGFTRTITTAISLETSKGELELALALGIILVLLAVVINIALNQLQHRRV